MRTPSVNASPTLNHAGVATPPEYVYSSDSQKRRRFSPDVEAEERASRVPRLYASSHPDHPQQRPPAPTSQPSTTVVGWHDPPRSDPFLPPSRAPGGWDESMRTERGPIAPPSSSHLHSPRPRSLASEDSIAGYQTRLAFPPENGIRAESSPVPYPRNGYAAYHPAPGPSPYPSPPCGYAGHYADCMCNRGGAGMTVNGDGKARKRRGNLPKETTDVLRRWFIAHLHHPYPTEEEKQALMKQTRLQISKAQSPHANLNGNARKRGKKKYTNNNLLLTDQISNWFINARRRQMPVLGASPQKGGAKSRRNADGKRLGSRERSIKSIDKASSTSSSDEETTTPTSSSVLSYQF